MMSLQRAGHVAHLGVTLPVLLRKRRRILLGEMRDFIVALPERLEGPLAESMAALTPDLNAAPPEPHAESAVRSLADLAIALETQSPIGLCLRRSLTRYYFLRREGLPLKIHYGARMIDGEPDRQFNGHAWLTLNGEPYHEDSEHWRGFKVILTFPDVHE